MTLRYFHQIRFSGFPPYVCMALEARFPTGSFFSSPTLYPSYVAGLGSGGEGNSELFIPFPFLRRIQRGVWPDVIGEECSGAGLILCCAAGCMGMVQVHKMVAVRFEWIYSHLRMLLVVLMHQKFLVNTVKSTIPRRGRTGFIRPILRYHLPSPYTHKVGRSKL
jgi:hypothetical protein